MGQDVQMKNGKSKERKMTGAQLRRQRSMCQESPPDGGWGWVVTFSAFMVGFILDGISFSFGVFFPHLLAYFNESKSLTSWVISVMNGTYLGIGPIAGMLVTRFGCRRVAMCGAVLAAVSFFLCSFSPNVQTMIILYGLLGGAGLGLLYLPSIVIVGYYFKTKRALATGIAVCGSGIGGFVFAPLSEFLIEQYTWKGAMWIISAVVLNGVVVAALFRPLTPDCRREAAAETELKTLVSKTSGDKCVLVSEKSSIDTTKDTQEKEKVKENGSKSELQTDSGTPLLSMDSDALLLQGGTVANGSNKPPMSGTGDEQVERPKESDKRTRTDSCLSEEEHAACCDLTAMFDFSLLRSPTFLVYGSSCFLCMLGFFIPFTYIPDLAQDMGLTLQEGAMLISIIGILNVGARIGVGWVADRPWANCLIINSVALLIGGVSTIFVPFYNSFGLLATYSVVFGTCIAVFVSLRSIIVAELLGIEKLTSSFGLVVMCQGLSAFIGAPIAGALSDMSGDYKGAFYMAGGAIALSGLICFPLRRISLWENQHFHQEPPGPIYTSALVLDQEMKINVLSSCEKIYHSKDHV